MSEDSNTRNSDGMADAIATVLLTAIAVAALVFWISNQ